MLKNYDGVIQNQQPKSGDPLAAYPQQRMTVQEEAALYLKQLGTQQQPQYNSRPQTAAPVV